MTTIKEFEKEWNNAKYDMKIIELKTHGLLYADKYSYDLDGHVSLYFRGVYFGIIHLNGIKLVW